MDGDAGERGLDVLQVVGGEGEGGGAEVFVEAVQLRGAGDGDDPRLLREEPGEGDLGGGGAEAGGDLCDEGDEGLVGLAVFFGETGEGVAEVVLFEAGGGGDGAGEKAAAKRAEGDEADAEFFQGGEDFFFGLAPPEGVFALEGGDGVDGVGAADEVGAGLGEAEVFDFALPDEVFDGAGDVFDGDGGVGAVLVKEVDAVGAEAAEGGVGDGADRLGAAVDAGGGEGVFKAELGGDDDAVADGGEGLADEFTAARYHSLHATPDRVKGFEVTALTGDVVMAIEDAGRRRWAVQFHPESILTAAGGAGHRIVANVLRLCRAR